MQFTDQNMTPNFRPVPSGELRALLFCLHPLQQVRDCMVAQFYFDPAITDETLRNWLRLEHTLEYGKCDFQTTDEGLGNSNEHRGDGVDLGGFKLLMNTAMYRHTDHSQDPLHALPPCLTSHEDRLRYFLLQPALKISVVRVLLKKFNQYNISYANLTDAQQQDLGIVVRSRLNNPAPDAAIIEVLGTYQKLYEELTSDIRVLSRAASQRYSHVICNIVVGM